MATDMTDVKKFDVKIEVKTEDDEVPNFSHSPFHGSSMTTEEIDVEELDMKRIYLDIEPTSVICSSQETDTRHVTKVISETDVMKIRRFRHPFRLLECPQCDKIFKRSYVSRLTKHVLERHRKSSKELLSIIYETYGLPLTHFLQSTIGFLPFFNACNKIIPKTEVIQGEWLVKL